MEVKPGYKQTEVGMIPIDWEEKSMDELTSLMTNGFVGTATNEYSDSDDSVLYIQGYNVKENGFNFNGIKRVNKNFHDRHMKSCLRSGDLLTIQTGDIGVTTMVTPDLAGSNCHALVISRFNVRFSDPLFYCYYFNSEVGRKKLKEIETGSTMKHLNVGDMKQIHVVAPPLREQTAIATALYGVDALVDSLDRLIAKKRDLKQAAMQQLLTGQTRLPGFSGEWEVKRLGDIGEVSGSGVDKKSHPDETPVRLVNYMDVYRLGFIESGNLDHWVTAQPHHLRRCSVERGDVFFTPSSETRQDIANSSVAIEDVADAAYSYHVVRLRLKDNWDLKYSAYAFKTRDFLNQAEMICDGGGTRYVISLGKFRAMTLPVPPISEQEAIGKILFDMDLEIKKLQGQREKTAALKQGMMQELLTGRTRLV